MRDKKRIPATVQVRFWVEEGRMQIALRSMKRFALCFYCCFLFFWLFRLRVEGDAVASAEAAVQASIG